MTTQLIRFVIDYLLLRLVADNNVKCETVCCCNATPQISSFQTYGLLTVLSLILLITGYVDYCSNVFIGNLLKKLNADELK